MATLREIAKRAGVTTMTVSNVLNGRYSATRSDAARRARKIRRIADQLGYRPNAAARATRSGQFGSVAIVVPANSVGAGMMFPAELLGAISDTASRQNLNITIADLWLDRLADDADYAPRLLRELSVDAVLAHWYHGFGAQAKQCIEAAGLPTIWMNELGEHDCVYPDDESAGHLACSRLIELGHRRISYLSFLTDKHYSVGHRGSGVQRALREAGLATTDVRAPIEPISEATPCIDEVRHWLAGDDRPTAVVAYGRSEVVCLMRAALDLRLRIPQDISLIQIEQSEMTNVTADLDTVVTPWGDVGRAAMAMLLQKLEGPTAAPMPARAVPFYASWAGSAGPANGQVDESA